MALADTQTAKSSLPSLHRLAITLVVALVAGGDLRAASPATRRILGQRVFLRSSPDHTLGIDVAWEMTASDKGRQAVVPSHKVDDLWSRSSGRTTPTLVAIDLRSAHSVLWYRELAKSSADPVDGTTRSSSTGRSSL